MRPSHAPLYIDAVHLVDVTADKENKSITWDHLARIPLGADRRFAMISSCTLGSVPAIRLASANSGAVAPQWPDPLASGPPSSLPPTGCTASRSRSSRCVQV